MESTPASRLVAKAWTDPDFKNRVLEDPIAASLEVGINWLNPTGFGTSSDFTALHILDDTPTLHHVVTCTFAPVTHVRSSGTPLNGTRHRTTGVVSFVRPGKYLQNLASSSIQIL